MSDMADDRPAPTSLAHVDRSVAVLSERVNGLRSTSKDIERKLDAALAASATKEELKAHAEIVEEKQKVTNKRLDKLEGYISWGVKIVMLIVISAVVGLVVMKGKG